MIIKIKNKDIEYVRIIIDYTFTIFFTLTVHILLVIHRV